MFFCRSSEPFVKYPSQLLPAANHKMSSKDNLDVVKTTNKDLATAWQVMRRFCLLVNVGTQTRDFMRSEIINDTIAAVMYRLMHMGFATDSFDEALRYGLLVFTYHVFLQWQDIKPPSKHLPMSYKKCILGLGHVHGVSSQLMLWLLMIGANSIVDISHEAWLREGLREHADICGAETWKEMEDILKSFMWITLLDEQPGKQIHGLLYM